MQHHVVILICPLILLTMSFKILSGLFLGFCIFHVETYFSTDKDIWIATTDDYMYFYIIVIFPLTAILQLINITAS